MKNGKRGSSIVILLSAVLVMSCMLPGMIPLNAEPNGSLPVMETDTNRVIEVLSGTDWRPLQALASEQYTEEDYAKPGTLTYTVMVTDDLPTYFSYGWCAVDEETLRQNFEHIDVQLYINGEKFPSDAIHNLSFTSSNSLLCLDFGVLLSDWPEGDYTLEAVATFDGTVNDGLGDYVAGDYIFVYNVKVQKTKEGAAAPS
jgi:hypothetical protein